MQPSEEFEQNNFDRIQCALDIVHTIDELEYPLQSRSSTPKDTALLILDDFLLHTITDEREVKVLFEILEKRAEIPLSTVVCSQREPNSWKAMILNDEVSANSIMKRATKHYTVKINTR